MLFAVAATKTGFCFSCSQVRKGKVLGALQVEERRAGAAEADELPGEGGLADLAWAEECHDGELTREGGEPPQVAGPLDHGPRVTGHLSDCRSGFKILGSFSFCSAGRRSWGSRARPTPRCRGRPLRGGPSAARGVPARFAPTATWYGAVARGVVPVGVGLVAASIARLTEMSGYIMM